MSMDIYSMVFIKWVKDKNEEHSFVSRRVSPWRSTASTFKKVWKTFRRIILPTYNAVWNFVIKWSFHNCLFHCVVYDFSSTSSKKGRWNKLKVVIWYSWVIQRYVNLRGGCVDHCCPVYFLHSLPITYPLIGYGT